MLHTKMKKRYGLVPMLLAFAMALTMMPLLAFGTDNSESYEDLYLSDVYGGENQIGIKGVAEKQAIVEGARTLYVDLYKQGEQDTPFMTGSVKVNRDGTFDGKISQVPAGTYNIKAYCSEAGPIVTCDNIVVTGADALYHLYIGGKQVTSANTDDVFGDGKVKFIPASGNDPAVLLLNNYSYEGLGYYPNSIHMGIDSGLSDLTIRIAGTNTITQEGSYAGHISSLGITAQKLTIEEDPDSAGGTLTVNATGEANKNLDTCGIHVEESLTVTGGTITVYAAKASDSSYGIFAKGGITISGGTVEASGYDAAVRGDVMNEMPGEGWKDLSTAETDQPDTIDVSSSPRELKYKDGNNEDQYYQKVRFTPIHKHSFNYKAGTGADKYKITATCIGAFDCPEGYKTNPITITLNRPADLTYNCSAKEASISGYPAVSVENLAPAPEIRYYESTGPGSTESSGEQLSGAPVNAGNYVAKATWGGAEAVTAFSIARYKMTLAVKQQEYTYNGYPQGEADPAYEDIDEIKKKVDITGQVQGGDYLVVLLEGTETEVGTYVNRIDIKASIFDGKDENVTDNYNLTLFPGTLVIKEKKPEPTTKPTSTKAPAAKATKTPLTEITTKGDHNLTITWLKVEGAAGYEVFFARCDGKGAATTKKVKTIKGNKTFTWTKSGLKKGTAYKAYVKAYAKKNGKKTYIGSSPVMHAYTSGASKKYTNAKSISVNKTKVKLKKGKTFKLKAKVKKLKKNKKLMPSSHVSTVRYLSTDKKIATVTKGGKITAKGKGTCYVYAYAHNGAYKKVKVTVK